MNLEFLKRGRPPKDKEAEWKILREQWKASQRTTKTHCILVPSGTKEYMRAYMQLRKAECYALLGGICKHCGFSDPRALQIDHVEGDGVDELRQSKRSPLNYLKKVILSVLAGENRYQLLCANCNWIKRAEQKETA